VSITGSPVIVLPSKVLLFIIIVIVKFTQRIVIVIFITFVAVVAVIRVKIICGFDLMNLHLIVT